MYFLTVGHCIWCSCISLTLPSRVPTTILLHFKCVWMHINSYLYSLDIDIIRYEGGSEPQGENSQWRRLVMLFFLVVALILFRKAMLSLWWVALIFIACVLPVHSSCYLSVLLMLTSLLPATVWTRDQNPAARWPHCPKASSQSERINGGHQVVSARLCL